MSSNIYDASRQWATRPADQRFNSLEELHAITKRHADAAVERTLPWSKLEVRATENDSLALVGPANNPAEIGHYAFGQIAKAVSAPASYLRTLPSTTVADLLNYGLAQREDASTDAALLFHRREDNTPVLRAAVTDRYSRIWNHEVVARLLDVSQRFNLVPARQTFTWDGSALPDESERPAALYASDHDMFAFVMSVDRETLDPVGKSLFKGLIVTNSEVGDKSLSLRGFWFRDICQNHIIWGTKNIAEVSLTHRGDIRQRWIDATVKVRQYFNDSLGNQSFAEATVRIADDKEAVLDKLFGIKSLGLSRKALAASYDAVVIDEDGDPRTVWGMAQGITRHSQTLPYAEDRADMDKAAGRLLAFTF